MDSNKFQKWSDESKQTLFCPGIPGAGKTMVTSITVEHLQAKFQNDPGIGIAYLYCNFRQQEQKPADLLLSLLKQLIQRRLYVPEEVTRLYKRHNNERTRPSFDDATSSLLSSCSEIITHVNTTLVAESLGLLPAQPETPANPAPRPGSSQSQKIALGVCIAIGVPSTLISLIMILLKWRHY